MISILVKAPPAEIGHVHWQLHRGRTRVPLKQNLYMIYMARRGQNLIQHWGTENQIVRKHTPISETLWLA